MRILVLGGAGYIGSHTALELVRAGHEVIVADNLVTGHRSAVPKQAKFYEGDIRDAAFLDKLFDAEKIDAVIHFAAFSLVGESVANPLKYYNNNLCGTEVLLEAMVRHGLDKIVFSSTAATYGEPENIPILESDRTCPTNPYGETKLAMEKMFHWTAKAHGLRYVSLRYFNACGADASGTIGEAHDPESHLIPLILKSPTANGMPFPSMVRITTHRTEPAFGTTSMSPTWHRLIFWRFVISRMAVRAISSIWETESGILSVR